MGDPVKVLLLESMVQQIHDYKLLDLVNASGKVLMDGLGKVQVSFLTLSPFLDSCLLHLIYNFLFVSWVTP